MAVDVTLVEVSHGRGTCRAGVSYDPATRAILECWAEASGSGQPRVHLHRTEQDRQEVQVVHGRRASLAARAWLMQAGLEGELSFPGSVQVVH